MTCTRGATNGNVRGNNTARRQRREWLVQTYRADVNILVDPEEGSTWPTALPVGHVTAYDLHVHAACRCYRCGTLLTVDTLTVDRIFPGILGGLYRTVRRDKAEKVTNIRPACGPCNEKTGGALATRNRKRK